MKNWQLKKRNGRREEFREKQKENLNSLKDYKERHKG